MNDDDEMRDFLEVVSPPKKLRPEILFTPTEDPLEAYEPPPPPTFVTEEEQVQEILRRVPNAPEERVRGLGPMAGSVLKILTEKDEKVEGDLLRELLVAGRLCTVDMREAGHADAPKRLSDLKSWGLTFRTYRKAKEYYYELDPSKYVDTQADGRRPLSKAERREIMQRHTVNGACLCRFCQVKLSDASFAGDHNIPLKVAGNREHQRIGVAAFGPICTPCNTQKAHHCKQCPNHRSDGDLDFCRACYLHDPTNATWSHVKGKPRPEVEADIPSLFRTASR